jgi:DNA transposition AAA+ family ATPase
MKNELKKQIAEGLSKYLEDNCMSQNVFSEQTGINVAYLSALRAGNHNVGATPIADKWYFLIADKIGYKLEKSYWETIPTSQLKRIVVTLEDAKKFGYTNTIIGETGSGKSFVAEMFARKYPVDAFKVIISQSDNINDIIDKILDALKIAGGKSRSKKLIDIQKHLKNMKHQGFTPILIFDEAEFMKQPALCAIKELYDNLKGTCAIILIGTNQLLKNFEKLRKRNKDGMPQLYRRLKFGIRILPVIDRNFSQFLIYIEDKALRRFIIENCDNYGELHDVLMPAMREADRLGEPLTEDFVRTILNMPKL